MKITYNGKEYQVEKPIKVQDLLKEEIQKSLYKVVGCILNHEYQNLAYEIQTDGTIELIHTNSKEGMKIYARTLIYIMGKAFETLYPGEKMTVEYRLGNAMFCTCDTLKITQEFLQKMTQQIQKIVDQDLPIEKVVMTREEAQMLYEKNNTSKGRLQFDLEENEEINMYYCEDYFNYCFGTIASSTGIAQHFEMIPYSDGFLIRYPSSKAPNEMQIFKPTKKLSWALEEYEKIHKILDMNMVYKLNKAIEENRMKEVIMLAEALHEKKIANIADDIAKRNNIKMVLIAGPSSSGKTTFAQRLGIQLRLNGLKPVTISVDNYFVERQDNPRDENGEYDFECIEAIDLKLLNEHLVKLLNGEEVEMPKFDFHVGTKRYDGTTLKLEKDEILIMEGIHCLNDKLTHQIAQADKYKIYISALTVLNMDRYNPISTTDTRLIRRMVRDYQFRGYSAKHTLSTWHNVTQGEEKNIFPYQENADKIFNTSLIYEMNALKEIAKPLLEVISAEEPEHAEAQRLLNMLKYFKPIPKDQIPSNSLIKEFLGGGDFKY